MKIHSAEEMLEFGKFIASKLELPAVIELVGDVGVGKTTFAQGLAQGLGIDEEITSPSFTISKRYALPNNGELIHYDFYRLGDPGLMRSELAESLSRPHSVVVVEWGGDVSDLLPKHKVRLEIKLAEDGSREVIADNPSYNLWKTCGKPVEKVPQKAKKVQKNVDKISETCGKLVENAKNIKKLKENPQTIHPKDRSTSPNAAIKLYLDTSTEVCVLRINNHEYTRVGKYDLAEKILTFIHKKLLIHHADWQDIAEITFFSGPGSFTGLRIGAAIVNTLADQLEIPLFDHHGTRHQLILPNYGREANISAPRK